jgi:hypothetical protein
MPPAQVFFLALALVVWVGGAFALFVQHCRRIGKPLWKKMLLPFPYSEFNRSELLKLFGLMALSIFLGLIAVLLGPK